jgi:uncharacterized membrane protein
MEYQGLVIGFSAFVMALACRYLIRKHGHVLSGRIWTAVLVIGVIAIISSFFINEIIISAPVAILGCACLWAIYEKK